MTISNLYPALKPSLNLDFANVKALDPRITFARASTGTYYDGQTVAKAEENLLIRSQEFDSSPTWATSSSSVTANTTTAPVGRTTRTTLCCHRLHTHDHPTNHKLHPCPTDSLG
jgi:hypothetical protein